MSHSQVIILGALDELIGDAKEGPFVELRAATVDADVYLINGEHSNDEQVHEELESVQTWLTDAYMQVAGVGATADEFTTTLNTLIGE